MRKSILAAALAASTISGAAAAQSTNTTSFRGLRVEGQVGGDRFQSQGTHNDEFGYGGVAGFDGMIGDRIVIGAEGGIWNTRNENCTPGAAGGTICHKSFQEYSAAVRAGVLVTPQVLVYGKGGFVNNEQRKSFTGTGATGVGRYYDHFNTDGYQLGAGVEMSLTDMFYINGEFKYSNYADHTSRKRLLVGAGVRF